MRAPDRVEVVRESGWSARFTLGASDRLDDVHVAPLPRPRGHPQGKSSTDAESLFVAKNTGTMWIGLEGINQIWRPGPDFSRYEGRRALPHPPDRKSGVWGKRVCGRVDLGGPRHLKKKKRE